MEYALFVLVGLLGSLVSAVFGFGTALVVLAVGFHILPVKEVIVLGTVLFASSTLTKTALFFDHIDWKNVIIMSLASLPFAYLGAELLVYTPATTAKRLVAILVLLYLFLIYFDRLPTIKLNMATVILGSALYGFISGLLSSGNIVKAIMFREMKLSKESFVGAMAATSVLANFAKLTSYTSTGLFPVHLVKPAIALAVGVILVATFGRFLLSKLDFRFFEIGVQILLGTAALALLF